MARGKIEKRGQRRRKIKPVILIVTEGSQTEPKYFEHYRSRQTNIDIRVIGSRTSGGETDYLGLIRKAVEYQSKNQISASNGDAVWVVADGDVNYKNPILSPPKTPCSPEQGNWQMQREFTLQSRIPALSFGICCIFSTQQNFSKITLQ